MQRSSLALLLLIVAVPVAAADPPTDFTATEQVKIPAGSFTMGKEGKSVEYTPHEVSIGAFLMDVHEVTNAQYHAFCQATDRDLPFFWGREGFRCSLEYPDHPVVGVSRGDAMAYAAWVGGRLPTEAEWEYAARGGLVGLDMDRDYALAPDLANYNKSGHDGTVAVKSYEPNAYGLHDMIGNVREWVSDRYRYAHSDGGAVANPVGPEKGPGVVRGGGWFSGPGCQGVWVRNPLAANWGDFNVGFRCARDAADAD